MTHVTLLVTQVMSPCLTSQRVGKYKVLLCAPEGAESDYVNCLDDYYNFYLGSGTCSFTESQPVQKDHTNAVISRFKPSAVSEVVAECLFHLCRIFRGCFLPGVFPGRKNPHFS